MDSELMCTKFFRLGLSKISEGNFYVYPNSLSIFFSMIFLHIYRVSKIFLKGLLFFTCWTYVISRNYKNVRNKVRFMIMCLNSPVNQKITLLKFYTVPGIYDIFRNIFFVL